MAPIASEPLVVDYTATGLKVASYLLKQQNADGMIPDEPGSQIVNEDSNMEYALIGLAAAYRQSHNVHYLKGLERGITWLAAREEMTDPAWRGSWMYAYFTTSPYPPVPVSPDVGITDVRGVDSTSALFVYLLYLDKKLTGTDTLSSLYEPNARASLNFILAHNRSADGFFDSSWQKWESDGQWHLWTFRYSADQADDYLGMQAGWILYGDSRYSQSAKLLKSQTPVRFFSTRLRRYVLGMDEDGTLNPDLDGFDGVFSQGYLPWVFGANIGNASSYQWLTRCVRASGALICFQGDPQYSLSVDIYTLAASSLNRPRPVTSLNWLAKTTFDPLDGGVRDTRDITSEKYSNVAGFTVMAFLGFPNLLTP